jgi:serine/threonine protein kinase
MSSSSSKLEEKKPMAGAPFPGIAKPTAIRRDPIPALRKTDAKSEGWDPSTGMGLFLTTMGTILFVCLVRFTNGSSIDASAGAEFSFTSCLGSDRTTIDDWNPIHFSVEQNLHNGFASKVTVVRSTLEGMLYVAKEVDLTKIELNNVIDEFVIGSRCVLNRNHDRDLARGIETPFVLTEGIWYGTEHDTVAVVYTKYYGTGGSHDLKHLLKDPGIHLRASTILGKRYMDRFHLFPSSKPAYSLLRDLARAAKIMCDSGMVHMDISPDNVLITYDAAGEMRLKIMDFGRAAVSTPGWPHWTSALHTEVLVPSTIAVARGAIAPELGIHWFKPVAMNRIDSYGLSVIALVILAPGEVHMGTQSGDFYTVHESLLDDLQMAFESEAEGTGDENDPSPIDGIRMGLSPDPRARPPPTKILV